MMMSRPYHFETFIFGFLISASSMADDFKPQVQSEETPRTVVSPQPVVTPVAPPTAADAVASDPPTLSVSAPAKKKVSTQSDIPNDESSALMSAFGKILSSMGTQSGYQGGYQSEFASGDQGYYGTRSEFADPSGDGLGGTASAVVEATRLRKTAPDALKQLQEVRFFWMRSVIFRFLCSLSY